MILSLMVSSSFSDSGSGIAFMFGFERFAMYRLSKSSSCTSPAQSLQYPPNGFIVIFPFSLYTRMMYRMHP